MGTDGTITNRARAILAQRRQTAQVTANRRQEEITEKIPAYADQKKELAQTGTKLVQVVLAKPKDLDRKVAAIKEQNLAIQERMKALLVENGYPEDYLKVKYSCPFCEDTGYVERKQCRCLTQLIKQLGAEGMNRMSPLSLSDFDTFDLSYYPNQPEKEVNPREQMKRVYQYCKNYAESFYTGSTNLLLYGNTGLGKTHLSLSIAQVAMGKGYSAVYGSAQDLFRQVEKEHFGRDNPEKDTIGGLLNCDLLILDDLGAEFESNYYTSCLYNIINSRYNLKKPTIISTNLTPIQIKQRYPDRIVSRLLAGYQHLQFVGKDIRQIKMQQG